MKSRERHDRFSNDSPVLFRRENYVVEEVAKMKNYSKSGLNFLTESSLTPKTKINLVKVGWLSGQPLIKSLTPNRIAEVKWCKKVANGYSSCYSSGLEYCMSEKLKNKKSIVSNYLIRRLTEFSEKNKFYMVAVLAIISLCALWMLIGLENGTNMNGWEYILLLCLPSFIAVFVTVMFGYIYLKLHGITPTDKFRSLVGETVDIVTEKKITKERCSFLEGNWVYTLKNKEPRMEIYGIFNLRYTLDHEIKVQGKCWYYDTTPEDNKTRGHWNSIFTSFHNNTLLIVYEMSIQ